MAPWGCTALGKVGCISVAKMFSLVLYTVERRGALLMPSEFVVDTSLGSCLSVCALSVRTPPPPASPPLLLPLPGAFGGAAAGRREVCCRVSLKAEKAGSEPGAAPYEETG